MYFPAVGKTNWHLIGLLHDYVPSLSVINSKGFVFVHCCLCRVLPIYRTALVPNVINLLTMQPFSCVHYDP